VCRGWGRKLTWDMKGSRGILANGDWEGTQFHPYAHVLLFFKGGGADEMRKLKNQGVPSRFVNSLAEFSPRALQVRGGSSGGKRDSWGTKRGKGGGGRSRYMPLMRGLGHVKERRGLQTQMGNRRNAKGPGEIQKKGSLIERVGDLFMAGMDAKRTCTCPPDG